MPRTREIKEAKKGKRVESRRAEVEERNVFSEPSGASSSPQREELLDKYSAKSKYPYSYSYGLYEKLLPPCPVNVYSPAGCFKAPKPRFNSYLDSERNIQFPEIKLIPRDSSNLPPRERNYMLNEEEMEAAQALADFAYYARQKE